MATKMSQLEYFEFLYQYLKLFAGKKQKREKMILDPTRIKL